MAPEITIGRILKVNHAGEYGAIRIYGAQIWIARRFYPAIVAPLSDIREHEIEHCRLFRDAMPARGARPCRVMSFWSLGGFVLGFATALLGQRMIWICTEAVESAVHRHLVDQLGYLEGRDAELKSLISSIQDEELSHLHEAQVRRGGAGPVQRGAVALIGALTDMLIWLSTWGDSTRMMREMRKGSN
ncbi:demethoxyubiquinone hydroxylase family protein [Taklimakanibacter deserti]|uniref:demethoxyubiquinone hydroxylase family protein n=1 Tax=Taklimakanibacter deserti TaxID=2267839 RepID=UPI000E645F8A